MLKESVYSKKLTANRFHKEEWQFKLHVLIHIKIKYTCTAYWNCTCNWKVIKDSWQHSFIMKQCLCILISQSHAVPYKLPSYMVNFGSNMYMHSLLYFSFTDVLV